MMIKMMGKILCFLFGHKTDRLNTFKDRPLMQVIDPDQNKVMTVDACFRCGTVHVTVKEYQK